MQLKSFCVCQNQSEAKIKRCALLQEEYLDSCTDGTFKATQQKFFNCIPGHGLYFPLASLSPDKRVGGFSEQTSPLATSLKENRECSILTSFFLMHA